MSNKEKVLESETNEAEGCPYCGAKPDIVYSKSSRKRYIFCANDECKVKPVLCTKGTLEEAIRDWNHRVKNDAAEPMWVSEIRKSIQSLSDIIQDLEKQIEELKKSSWPITVAPPRDNDRNTVTWPYIIQAPNTPPWPKNPDGTPAITCLSVENNKTDSTTQPLKTAVIGGV